MCPNLWPLRSVKYTECPAWLSSIKFSICKRSRFNTALNHFCNAFSFLSSESRWLMNLSNSSGMIELLLLVGWDIKQKNRSRTERMQYIHVWITEVFEHTKILLFWLPFAVLSSTHHLFQMTRGWTVLTRIINSITDHPVDTLRFISAAGGNEG